VSSQLATRSQFRTDAAQCIGADLATMRPVVYRLENVTLQTISAAISSWSLATLAASSTVIEECRLPTTAVTRSAITH